VLAVYLLSGKMFFCADGTGSLLSAYYLTDQGDNINKTW
jgi:hypothetical protein